MGRVPPNVKVSEGHLFVRNSFRHVVLIRNTGEEANVSGLLVVESDSKLRAKPFVNLLECCGMLLTKSDCRQALESSCRLRTDDVVQRARMQCTSSTSAAPGDVDAAVLARVHDTVVAAREQAAVGPLSLCRPFRQPAMRSEAGRLMTSERQSNRRKGVIASTGLPGPRAAMELTSSRVRLMAASDDGCGTQHPPCLGGSTVYGDLQPELLQAARLDSGAFVLDHATSSRLRPSSYRPRW